MVGGKMEKNITKVDKGFVFFSYTMLALFSLLVAIPIINLVSVSVSGMSHVLSGNIQIWPKDFQIEAYKYVLSSKEFFMALNNSLYITFFGTILGVFLSVMAAYPLSKIHLPGRNKIMILFVFTMMFNGGIIPQYILMNKLGLLNNLWAVILPLSINVFNMLIVKNYFESIPEDIEEAAKIDGANQFTILIRVMLPLAIPVIATISLFYVVMYWNEYFYSRLFINEFTEIPLQVYLRMVIFEAMDPAGNFALSNANVKLAPQSIINTTVVLSMLPMIILYPFLQRFLLKGMIIGSVKG